MEMHNEFGREGADNNVPAKGAETPSVHPEQHGAGAGRAAPATMCVTPPPAALSGPESHDQADSQRDSAPPDPSLIGQIRLHYRLAKSAEQSRIAIDQRLVSFVRVYLTAWTPDGEEADRDKHKKQAARVVKTLQDAAHKMEPGQTIFDALKPHKDDADLYPVAAEMVLNAEPSRAAFDATASQHQKSAQKLAAQLPAWGRLQHIMGFSSWGLAVIVGEAGDIGNYSGVRKLYKALGWAPTECYRSEDGKAAAVPRAKKGRLYGIVQDPLFKQQWRGEKDEVPAHAIGPFGEVYGAAKLRHLEAGKTKGHAEKLARRAMLKALIHDVHRGWHGVPLDYAA